MSTRVEPMMKAGRSMGGQGAVVHGMDVGDKNPLQIGNGTKALCGTSCGPRSAGWAHMPNLQVTCERCAKTAQRAAQAAQEGE